MTLNKIKKTITELAVELPGAARFFGKRGMDYSRESAKPLPQSSSSAQVTDEPAITLFNSAEKRGGGCEANEWQTAPLSDLTKHLVNKYHDPARAALLRLRELVANVCSIHSRSHREFFSIRDIFFRLETVLTDQMIKEERILFPHIEALETSAGRGELAPMPFLETVINNIRTMMQEHDEVSQLLRELRELTANYQVPATDSIDLLTLDLALKEFERDLRQHIHLENDILFRRTVALQAGS